MCALYSGKIVFVRQAFFNNDFCNNNRIALLWYAWILSLEFELSEWLKMVARYETGNAKISENITLKIFIYDFISI